MLFQTLNDYEIFKGYLEVERMDRNDAKIGKAIS